MQSYYPKKSSHSTTRLTSNVMIMKTLTTMRRNHIILSILYLLFKLMTLSLLLEMFELFNTVFDKEIFHIELPLLQCFLQKHVRDVHLALSLLWCGIAFQDVGCGDVKHRVVLCLLPPFVVAVNIREGCHFPAFQDHRSVIELTFASCASQMHSGRRRVQMTAVFSDSTNATLALTLSWSRCSPNRHWVSLHSGGSRCAALRSVCTHITGGEWSSLMRWPVSGL